MRPNSDWYADDVSPRLIHAELKFAGLARDKLLSIFHRFKLRISGPKLTGLVKTCSEQFRNKILFAFKGDEPANYKWAITGLDGAPGFPGLEDRVLEFTMDEIRNCISPAVMRIQNHVMEAINEKDLTGTQIRVSCVLKSDLKAVPLLICHICSISS